MYRARVQRGGLYALGSYRKRRALGFGRGGAAEENDEAA